MQKHSNTGQEFQTISPKDNQRYIDPKTDFAFKHFFCKEPHKDLLIKFLNSFFLGRKLIVDIKYSNVEQKGILKTYRKTIFDLYCTGDKGEKFIIEMQKADRDHFKDRIIFYTANLIQEQGISVNTNWNYELPEIYFIAIMNFSLQDSHRDHYIHDVRLMEMNTNEQFYHKLGYIFVELPKFNKNESELKTDQDYWLYILKNLQNFNEIPVTLSNKEEFINFFKIAEVSNLSQEDMDAYQQSLKIQRDNYTALKTAEDRAKLEGYTHGEYKKAIEMAIKMKASGEPLAKISKYTDLSIEEIEAL